MSQYHQDKLCRNHQGAHKEHHLFNFRMWPRY